MADDHLRDIDRILGDLQQSKQYPNRNIQKDHRNQLVKNDSEPELFTQIYDEFAPPTSPPPIPPDSSVTVVLDTAPPPPAPISQKISYSDSKLNETTGKGPVVNRQQPSVPMARQRYHQPLANQPFGGKSVGSSLNNLTPEPPPRMKKSQTSPNVTELTINQSSESLDGPEEIDFGEQEDEAEKRNAELRRKQLSRMSQIVRFDKVKPEEFDLDKLLNDLESVIMEKNPTNGADKPGPIIPPRKSSFDEGSRKPESSNAQLPAYPRKVFRAHEDNAARKLAHVLESAMRTEKNKKVNEDFSNIGKEEKKRYLAETLNDITVQKISTRIYIENSKNFKTLILTSLMSAAEVTQDLVKKCHLEDSNEWTLFEIVGEYAIERPLRDFEILTDVIGTWEEETVNSILLKKYKYRDSLTYESSKDPYPRMCGWMYHEVRKGKWQKRFFELKTIGLYHSKDSRGTDETLLFPIGTFDVYTLMRVPSKSPTKFCFAMKSQDKVRHFGDLRFYVRYLCVEHIEKMKDWVLSIRNAKSRVILKELGDYESRDGGSSRTQNVIRKAGSTGQIPAAYSIEKIPELPSDAVRLAERDRKGGKTTEPQKKTTSSPVPARQKDKNEKVTLINIVERQQGMPEDTNGAINLSQFGDYESKPLVPFSAKELFNIPGVNLQKYQVSKPESRERSKPAYKTCSTCGCSDFARNPFRETSCANCFHIH